MVVAHIICLFVLCTAQLTSGEANEYSKALTKLGMGILKNGNIRENQLLSTWGYYYQMATLFLGAGGNTKLQLGTNLFNSHSDKDINEIAKARRDASPLQTPSKFSTVYMANRMYADSKQDILKKFNDVLSKYYVDSEMKRVDFKKSAEAVRKEINTFVEKKTNNKMRDIMAEHALQASKLVLISAIYEKYTWVAKFNKLDTRKRDFYTTENEKTVVDMMNKNNTEGYYLEDDKVQVLGLPLAIETGSERVMFIILPKKPFGLSEIVSSMTVERFQELITKVQKKSIQQVYIPRFDLEIETKADDFFKHIGLTDMYIPGKADFSGIDGLSDLYLTDLIHKMRLDINEDGGEPIRTAPGPPTVEKPVIYNANRPFLFAIVDPSILNPLYMGLYVKTP